MGIHGEEAVRYSHLTLFVGVQELEGGELMTWREGRPVIHVLGRGDALLFPSEKVSRVGDDYGRVTTLCAR
jgi:streptomycin 6-kinase